MSDLSPQAFFERVLASWWIIAASMILGGAAGWIFSQFHAPLYEATAVYEVSLDQQQIASRLFLPPSKLPLDAVTQNNYLAPVENTFTDPDVRAQLVAEAQAQGLPLKYQEITPVNFSIDRRGVRWFLTVWNPDPVVAAHLANLWVGIGDTVLQKAQAHSNLAQSLLIERTAVQKCFSESDFTQANSCAGASFSKPEELQTYLNQLDQQIENESSAGHNIDPALTLAFVQQAEPPQQPVLYITSEIILAGSLIGLLVGIIVGQSWHAARTRIP